MKSLPVLRFADALQWFCAGVLALSLAACGGSDEPSTTATLTASLSGDQEVPPTITGAVGTGTLSLASPSRELSGGISLNGMTATAAHVHLGEIGTNGAVIVPLAETAAGSGMWAVPSNTVITQDQAAAFAAGGLYFNAHSTENPGGEVRGQIGRQVFAAQLAAAQEVPVNATTATGNGLLSLDPATKKFAKPPRRWHLSLRLCQQPCPPDRVAAPDRRARSEGWQRGRLRLRATQLGITPRGFESRSLRVGECR